MKVTFQPEPAVNGGSVVPPAALTVYDSNAVPGAISLTLSDQGAIQGGLRLSKTQARLLARTLTVMAREGDA